MKAVCCNQCFESIAREDTLAARAWLDLCACASRSFNGLMWFKEQNAPSYINAFRLLERLGYIASVDGLEAVKVKVNGHVDILEGQLATYCIDRHGHGHDWK